MVTWFGLRVHSFQGISGQRKPASPGGDERISAQLLPGAALFKGSIACGKRLPGQAPKAGRPGQGRVFGQLTPHGYTDTFPR